MALAMREGSPNDLLDRLAADERLPLSREDLDRLLADRLSFTGVAPAQVATVAKHVEAILARFPEAASYQPQPIL